jgi:hypothetical protein
MIQPCNIHVVAQSIRSVNPTTLELRLDDIRSSRRLLLFSCPSLRQGPLALFFGAAREQRAGDSAAAIGRVSSID